MGEPPRLHPVHLYNTNNCIHGLRPQMNAAPEGPTYVVHGLGHGPTRCNRMLRVDEVGLEPPTGLQRHVTILRSRVARLGSCSSTIELHPHDGASLCRGARQGNAAPAHGAALPVVNQKPPLKVMKAVVLVPPPWLTVVFTPRLASNPNSFVRAPSSSVP